MSFQNGMACAADAAQTEPMTATQVRNSAGGYVFAVDDMTRLRRFCILGAEGGTYYASERQLKLEIAQAVARLVESGRVAEAVGELVGDGWLDGTTLDRGRRKCSRAQHRHQAGTDNSDGVGFFARR